MAASGREAEAVGAAAVAAVEKHFAMHGLYGLAPPSTAALPPSPQQQSRQLKQSAASEHGSDDQDFLSSPHSNCRSVFYHFLLSVK